MNIYSTNKGTQKYIKQKHIIEKRNRQFNKTKYPNFSIGQKT